MEIHRRARFFGMCSTLRAPINSTPMSASSLSNPRASRSPCLELAAVATLSVATAELALSFLRFNIAVSPSPSFASSFQRHRGLCLSFSHFGSLTLCHRCLQEIRRHRSKLLVIFDPSLPSFLVLASLPFPPLSFQYRSLVKPWPQAPVTHGSSGQNPNRDVAPMERTLPT